MAGDVEGETILDARGLSCPLPVLKARKRLQAMVSGQRLRVLATDPKAPADFRLYCSESGHRLIAQHEAGAEFQVLIERA
jgi:tRNA 2-thiouridine synthesizing protein A